MKKKLTIVVLLIIIIIALLSYKLINNKENGNSSNMGLVCEYKDMVFYNKYEKGIFLVQNNKEKQLTSETAYSLNIQNKKVYYMTVVDFNSVAIKSIDFDGQNMKNLANIYTSISKFYIEGNYIYYTTNSGISKIDLDGNNEQNVLDEKVKDFQVNAGKIYYINSENKICVISTVGEENNILSDEIVANKMQVIDNWIYYYDQNENALFRLKNNGKKKELISVLVKNETYNISGEYVYYFDKENSQIAKMKIGRSDKCEKITQISVSKTKINIAKDEIYYLDKSENEGQIYQIRRIKNDGKQANDIIY